MSQQVKRFLFALIASIVAGVAFWIMVPGIAYQVVAGIILFGAMLDIALEHYERNSATQRTMKIVISLIIAMAMYFTIRIAAVALLKMPIFIPTSWGGSGAHAPNVTPAQAFTLEIFLTVIAIIAAFFARPQYDMIRPEGQPEATPTLVLNRKGARLRAFFYVATCISFVIVAWTVYYPESIKQVAKVVNAHRTNATQQLAVHAAIKEAQHQPTYGTVKPGTIAKLYMLQPNREFALALSSTGKKCWLNPGTKIMELRDIDSVTRHGLLMRKVRVVSPDDEFVIKDPNLEFWVQDGDIIWTLPDVQI